MGLLANRWEILKTDKGAIDNPASGDFHPKDQQMVLTVSIITWVSS